MTTTSALSAAWILIVVFLAGPAVFVLSDHHDVGALESCEIRRGRQKAALDRPGYSLRRHVADV